MQTNHFYAHGKLLLSGEYVVLDGSLSLALPTQLGQHLTVEEGDTPCDSFQWIALQSNGEEWINTTIEKSNLNALEANEVTNRLSIFLRAVRVQNPSFLVNCALQKVTTKLDFPNEWGLGSSSTLISLLAQWGHVNPYTILNNTIGGSGYDIACATSKNAILYTNKNGEMLVQNSTFYPSFKEHLYFAYLGKKQLSSESIKHHKQFSGDRKNVVSTINEITNAILGCTSVSAFSQLIHEHEKTIGDTLKLTPIKNQLFSDYWDEVKSLGGWGGDFALFVNTKTKEELVNYLSSKNIHIIFKYDEIILN
jgi:mevalonate kinase